MVDNSLVYSNARVKTMENSLLSREKLQRILYAESLEEGVKTLVENGYGGGIAIEDTDFSRLLDKEEKILNSFIAECLPKNSGMESFIIYNDYHNAKACCKAKYGKVSISSMLAPNGLLNVEKLEKDILEDKYDSLFPRMSEALFEIDKKFAQGKRDPRIIDIELDKAFYRHVVEILKKTKSSAVSQYWKAKADFVNLSSLKRSRKISEDVTFFKENLVEGGELKDYFLTQLYSLDDSEIAEKLTYTSYKTVTTELFVNNNTIAYEQGCDNYLLGIFKEKKNDIFTVSPIAGYYIAKKQEIKIVRMILICLKNNVEKNEIKKRLRDNYD